MVTRFVHLLFCNSSFLNLMSMGADLSRPQPIMNFNKINEGSDCRGAIHCALVPGRFTWSKGAMNCAPTDPQTVCHSSSLRPVGCLDSPGGRNELRPYIHSEYEANLGFTMGSRLWGRLRFVVG